MSKIWFTSDTHAFHSNITRGVTKWGTIISLDGADIFYPDRIHTRDFLTVEEMTQALIDNINKYVMEDDILYHLGDWSFGGIDKIWEFRKQINCKNINLISGNHDHHIKTNKILPNCPFKELYEYFNPWNKSNNLNNQRSQELFLSVNNYLELKIDKQVIVLSHFPIQEWYEMDKGSIHLHGHCHHKLDNDDLNLNYKRMDVGIDWEEFRPYSLEEIKEIMNKRKIKNHG